MVLASWWPALRSVVRWLVWPLGAYTSDERAAIERERVATNLRRLRVIAPLTLLVHTLAQVQLQLGGAADAPWRRGASFLAVFGLPLSLWHTFVVLHPWGARLVGYRRVIGEVGWLAWALLGAATSAGAQRYHGSITAYVAVMLLGVSVFSVRDRYLVLGASTAAGLLLTGVQRFQRDPSARVALSYATVEVALLTIAVSRVNLGALAREVTARLALERARGELEALNGQLEQRVRAQVGELVRHADEVHALNDKLARQVRERSRELSQALARLAERSLSAAPSRAGELLAGHVELGEPLGRGGMGVVYAAKDRASGKAVAVKLVHAAASQNIEDLRRFLREAEVLASLRHPAIVRTEHVGVTDDGRLFLVLERIEGHTLKAYLARQPRLAQGVVARLGARLAEALAAAHAQGVVHRDVKPSNVMLTGAAPGVKLLDFGLARVRSDDAGDTRSGDVLGTPAFMAPEQISDARNTTARADCYALGALVYVALTGRGPFVAEGPSEWLMKHAHAVPDDPAALVDDLDGELRALLLACLAKEPAARPASDALARALDAVAERLGAPSAERIAEAALAELRDAATAGAVSATAAASLSTLEGPPEAEQTRPPPGRARAAG